MIMTDKERRSNQGVFCSPFQFLVCLHLSGLASPLFTPHAPARPSWYSGRATRARCRERGAPALRVPARWVLDEMPDRGGGAVVWWFAVPTALARCSSRSSECRGGRRCGHGAPARVAAPGHGLGGWPCAPPHVHRRLRPPLEPWRRARRRRHDFSAPDETSGAERSLDAQRNRQGNARPRQARRHGGAQWSVVDVRSATPRGARDAEVLRPSSGATPPPVSRSNLRWTWLGATCRFSQPAWLDFVAAFLPILFWRLVCSPVRAAICHSICDLKFATWATK
ncbi:hypothetical protein PVAP13_4KG132700 [Panicum virgatum]|uniref:Uncharacterized protein n=1 Tax=Panicum virgatum TaxID=38727 RepID=A0A8T0TQG3_PANVG|nr:hypothetical protein PVAP13_4KG132700 [Panicum virgatum]